MAAMRHFDHIDAARRKHLFYRHPRPFDRHDDPAVLAVALGATLYCPATRPVLADDVLRSARRGVKSMVLCLEDAIGDDEVEAAEANLVAQLRLLHGTVGDGPEVPLLFVRVRDPRQIGDLIVPARRRRGAGQRVRAAQVHAGDRCERSSTRWRTPPSAAGCGCWPCR